MKVTLPDALHARPANLLVRAAKKLASAVFVEKDDRRADAREILQVLSLGARKGDEVTLSGEASAVAAIAEVMRAFDPDLVPETGTAAATGIAVGEALLVDDLEPVTRTFGDDDESRARAAFDEARRELAEMLETLVAHERQLFEPERAILDALEPAVIARVRAGESAVEAVCAEATHGPSDLVDDARARLLTLLAGDDARLSQALAERSDRELVVVTSELTPTLVARLPPHVVAIVAVVADLRETRAPSPSSAGTTSHAAILARGRGLPLAYLAEEMAAAVIDGSLVVVDCTAAEARVFADPSDALIEEARARRRALAVAADAERAAAVAARRIVTLRANVGAVTDDVPELAEGVGLVRTELVFAAHARAPREEEQVAAYVAIARKTRGPVYVRLFDAGGDKHLAFLGSRTGARGIELLLENDEVLRAQLRAIGRSRESGDVRALIPLVRAADDVAAVRARAEPGLSLGAMIETGAAARDARAIAAAADFVCIGTNDLASDVLQTARDAAPDALDPRVLAAIRDAVEGAHDAGRAVTVCGEIAADPRGGRVLVGLGVDALSVAPSRLPAIALDLSRTTREDCRVAAAAALQRR